MKSMNYGLALGATLDFNGSAGEDSPSHGGPDDGGESAFRPADEERRRTGGETSTPPAACSARSWRWKSRRCLRSQAGPFGRENIAGSKIPFVRDILFDFVDPGVEAYAGGNVLQITPASDQPLFTERNSGTWRVAAATISRPGRAD